MTVPRPLVTSTLAAAIACAIAAPALAQPAITVVATPVTKGQVLSSGFMLKVTPRISVEYDTKATIVVGGKKVVIAKGARTSDAYVGPEGPAPIDATIPPANTNAAQKAVWGLKKKTPVTLTFTGRPIDQSGIPVPGGAPFTVTVKTFIKK